MAGQNHQRTTLYNIMILSVSVVAGALGSIRDQSLPAGLLVACGSRQGLPAR